MIVTGQAAETKTNSLYLNNTRETCSYRNRMALQYVHLGTSTKHLAYYAPLATEND